MGSQGVWLPVVMIFVLLLVNRPELMGKYVNGRAFNILAWALSIAMIVLTMLFAWFLVSTPGDAAGSWLPAIHW